MASPRRAALTLPLFAALAASCGGAVPDSGIEASLRLTGAGVQYVPGALLDDPAAVGPAVHGISASGNIFPGAIGRSISGSVETGSSAVLIGLDGDLGHYIVPVTGLDIDNPPDLQFSAQASLARTTPVGADKIRVRAVGPDGNVGPGTTQGLTVQAAAVTGTLVVSLSWDTEADLDLHLVTPSLTGDGKPVELWSGNRTTLLPRSPLEGGSYTDDELAMAGIFDFDSNSQCVIDGLLNENAYWTAPPPPGHYIVRVDAFSMCGQTAAHWTVTVTEGGVPVGTFVGVATDPDTRFAHGAGTGLDVFEFDL
ncbi:MAG TPA: hypothetical protein VGP07_11485 [Polyangia bacterium]